MRALGPNSLLPSEQLLAKRFDVSRVTVRRALGLLERSGRLSRERGRGTIVNPPKITRRLSPFYRFEEDLTEQGIKFETRVIAYEASANPPDFVGARLKLPPQTTVGFLSLARVVEDRVVCCDRRYFPPALATRFDPSRVHERPVYEVLQELVGMPVTLIDWESEIVPAPPETATILHITAGVLVMANTFTEYLKDGFAVEAGVMCYRIDRFKFRSLSSPGSDRSD
jgi:DNA-binding GntR family transcriptional regulator